MDFFQIMRPIIIDKKNYNISAVIFTLRFHGGYSSMHIHVKFHLSQGSWGCDKHVFGKSISQGKLACLKWTLNWGLNEQLDMGRAVSQGNINELDWWIYKGTSHDGIFEEEMTGEVTEDMLKVQHWPHGYSKVISVEKYLIIQTWQQNYKVFLNKES